MPTDSNSSCHPSALCAAFGAALATIDVGGGDPVEITAALEAVDQEKLAFITGQLAAIGGIDKLSSPWPTPYLDDAREDASGRIAGAFWADGYSGEEEAASALANG